MPRGGRGGHGGPPPRSVLVSKALSRLLRHAAVAERIPIDSHGYVRIDHLLGWQRLRSMKPPVIFAEIVQVVQENEKKRFALKFVDPASTSTATAAAAAAARDGGKDRVVPPPLPPPGNDPGLEHEQGPDGEPETEAQVETTTQHAISRFESTPPSDLDLKRFFIRATQGHSMKTIEAENLLMPISLENPASIPDTVVHGTFYGAWEEILKSGGLKSMGRNHVHFATGPSLQEVWPSAATGTAAATSLSISETAQGDGDGGVNSSNDNDNDSAQLSNQNNHNHNHNHSQGHGQKNLAGLLGQNKVISGMRSDAQILIYIDIRRALAEDKDMKWWRSENGVILTDGVAASSGSEAAEKMVPEKYFLAAVEIKEGVGLLYEHATGGVVKELPEPLKSRPPPRGKGAEPRGARGARRGRGRERDKTDRG
ncbi:tRNA splicing 2' phosphotransferase 1 [Cladophialophora carrionii]|uniref:2'-phosphotransferase n=1 Tax=Cladophialophora carrionii TaxID=86049 RepID=A0A1C1CUZ2_9EURO|nr:tRNA splicing 2' phosphotransferase 1 [Cladophialophora carrionii]